MSLNEILREDVSETDDFSSEDEISSDEILDASGSNVNNDVSEDNGGNVQLTLIHKAIFAHFYSKEVCRNIKFKWKTFLLNNPHVKQQSAKYYHKNPNIIKILSQLKLKYGKVPFENHLDIQWVNKEGSLICLYDIPYDVIAEYAPNGDTTRKRGFSSASKGKARKVLKKTGKIYESYLFY
jgi:hypothetical protein